MRNALRQNHESFLQAPAKQNLRSSLVVLGYKWLEQRIVATGGTDKRRVGLEDNAALRTPVHDIGSGEPWVQLDLVHAEDASVGRRLLLR